jgi:hypothetical protein
MSDEITLEIFFHDESLISLSGITIPNPAEINALSGAVPRRGEVLRFDGVNYKTGEMAIFRVVSVAHLFGGSSVHRIQVNVELVVLHQP